MKEEKLLLILENINTSMINVITRIQKIEANVFNHEEPKELVRQACKKEKKGFICEKCGLDDCLSVGAASDYWSCYCRRCNFSWIEKYKTVDEENNDKPSFDINDVEKALSEKYQEEYENKKESANHIKIRECLFCNGKGIFREIL